MQFFIDSQGTVVNLISSPVYQGSTNACELVLVAPFSASNIIEADFRLPNGMSTTPRIMTVQPQPMMIDGKTYNVWRVLLDGTITEYAGKATVQFKVYQSGYNAGNEYHPIALTTYASTFMIEKGVVPTLPEFDELTPDIYSTILAYLTELNPQYNIKSVSYETFDGTQIDTDEAVDSLETIPSNAIYTNPEVSFDVDNIDGSENEWFFAIGANYDEDTGFTMTFKELTNVGKMQITFGGIYDSVYLKVMATLEDDREVEVSDFRIQSVEDVNTLVAVNRKVKAISIIQPYATNEQYDNNNTNMADAGYTRCRYFIRKIQLWHPTTDGQMTITSSTGRTIIFPDASYDAYVTESEQARDEAQGYAQNASDSATNAQNALDQILSKSGQVGGYPVLENIGGKPKIPSVYINLVDATVFTTITNENELETLVAPVGAIARLVVDIDDVVINGQVTENLGDKVVTKSFVKLQEGTGTDKWALFATSYADNASNALHAEQATNALRVNNLSINGVLSEADYNALASKQGVYFVSIEGGANGN